MGSPVIRYAHSRAQCDCLGQRLMLYLLEYFIAGIDPSGVQVVQPVFFAHEE